MRIPVEKKKDDLESWLHQLQKQISELKPDNEEVQAKLKELQVSLDQAIKNQVKQQSQQIQCQKQIALLRSQIEEASNAKNIQLIEEKLKNLEADLTQLKSILPTDIITHLKTLQDEYLNLKKGSEQVAKFNSGLRAHLQSVIEENARQDAVLSELQVQLSQTKMALNKRLAALEGRVGNLEVKHAVLEVKVDAFVAKTDPTYTVVQKLLKLRQVVLEDKYISEELKYYVAPNGESQPGMGDHEALYEWTQKNLLDTKAEARVLLLQGQGGAGKSTFNRFLLRELWQDKAWEDFKPAQPVPNAYIPIFIPLGSAQVDPNKLFNYFLDLPELVEGFTESEINVLKKDFRLLLIADGYDEIPGARHRTPNLYDDNQLHKYEGRIKLIISCRSQRSQELNEATYFVPHDHGKPQDSFYKRRSVSPFDDKQMASYIEKYLVKNKTRTDITLWPDVTTYQKHIESLPDLRKLIDTPFLLMITVEVLPQIVAEVEKESKAGKESKMADTNQLTRAKLYDRFVANWFERQAKKALETRELPEQEDIRELYQQFCLKLAECFRAAQVTAIQYPWKAKKLFAEVDEDKENPNGPRGKWVKELFGNEQPEITKARKGAPLRTGADNYHQFIHASLIDYFLTTAIHQQTKTREAVVETDLKAPEVREPTSATTHVVVPTASAVKGLPLKTAAATPTKPKTPISSPVLSTSIIQKPIAPTSHLVPKPTVKKQAIILPEMAISSAETLLLQQNLSQEQVYFLADRVIEDESFKKYLFGLIERSKKEADIAIASANAITVLNAARTSFSGMDFKDIRIPGADLSQAVLDSTQLQGADLSGVTLAGAWLCRANLSQSQMEGVKYGEWPYITLPDKAWSYAYSPDGNKLAIGWLSSDGWGSHNNISFYNIESRILERTLKKMSGGVIAFDAKGERLASGGGLRIELWKVSTGELERTMDSEYCNGSIVCFTFDPRGERLAAAVGNWNNNGIIYLWQVSTGQLERTFIIPRASGWGQRSAIINVAFQAKGDRLISINRDGALRLWQVETGQLERTFEVRNDEEITTITFDAKGECLAVVTNNNIHLWQVSTGRLVRTLEGKNRVLSVAFDPSGEYVASGSVDNTVRLWQVSTGQLKNTFEGHTDKVCYVIFDRTEKCIVSVSEDKTVRLWQVGMSRFGNMPGDNLSGISSVALSASGDHLASASDYWQDETVCLWRIRKEQLALERLLKGRAVVAFDKKGERLATGGGWYINIWQASKGKLERTLEGRPRINSLAFDIKGERLACAFDDDFDVKLWQLSTGRLEREFRHSGSVSSVAFDPTGEYLATGCHWKVLLWRVSTGRLEKKSSFDGDEGHKASVECVTFDSRGEFLASGGWDSTVRLWQVGAGKLKQKHKLEGHRGGVLSIAFDAGGERIASGSNDLTVRLWQVATGVCLAVLTGFYGRVNSVSWQPMLAASFLATGSSDKAVRYWRIEKSKDEKEKLCALLCWTSHQAVLTATDLCIDGVIGLDETGRDLLQQRGAKGTPAEFKSLESQKASSSPAKKDPSDIRGLVAPATRLGLLAAPSVPPISTSVSVDAKAIAEPKTL